MDTVHHAENSKKEHGTPNYRVGERRSGSGSIAEVIRRGSLNRSIACAAVATVMFLGYVVYARYWINYFQGPFELPQQTLISISDPAILEHYFLRVHVDGLYKIQERGAPDEKPRSQLHFSFAKVGNHALIVRHRRQPAGSTLVGSIEPFTPQIERFVRDLVAHNNVQEGEILPYILDITNFRADGHVALGLGAPFFLCLLLTLLRSIRYQMDVETHPLFSEAQQWGKGREVVAQIDRDLATDSRIRIATALIGRQWVLSREDPVISFRATDSTARILKLEELAWVYQLDQVVTTDHQETSRMRFVYLHDRNDRVMLIGCVNQTTATRLLDVICARAPGAVRGHDTEMLRRWRENREAFLADVDARIKEHAAQQAAPSPTPATVTVVIDLTQAVCRFCTQALLPAPVVICPECQAPHHAECWKENDERCTTFGCKVAHRSLGVV
jgi:hypothetical protein